MAEGDKEKIKDGVEFTTIKFSEPQAEAVYLPASFAISYDEDGKRYEAAYTYHPIDDKYYLSLSKRKGNTYEPEKKPSATYEAEYAFDKGIDKLIKTLEYSSGVRAQYTDSSVLIRKETDPQGTKLQDLINLLKKTVEEHAEEKFRSAAMAELERIVSKNSIDETEQGVLKEQYAALIRITNLESVNVAQMDESGIRETFRKNNITTIPESAMLAGLIAAGKRTVAER